MRFLGPGPSQSGILRRPVAFRLLWHDRRGSTAVPEIKMEICPFIQPPKKIEDAFGGSSPGA